MKTSLCALVALIPFLALAAPLEDLKSAPGSTTTTRLVETQNGLQKRWQYCEYQTLGAAPVCSLSNGHSCEKELGPEWKGGKQDFSWCVSGYKLECIKCGEVPSNCEVNDGGDEVCTSGIEY